jgi:hypothetical protein
VALTVHDESFLKKKKKKKTTLRQFLRKAIMKKGMRSTVYKGRGHNSSYKRSTGELT